MRKRKALINLAIVSGLWFSLAFSCKMGNNRSTSSRGSNEPSQRRTTQTRTGVGAPYEARDPYTCADTSKPTSARAVAANFRCNSEEEHMEKLTLVEYIVISEMGSPRQYDHYHDMEAWGIDATQVITPIKGSFDLYGCAQVSDYMQNHGKNCLVIPEPEAEGLCYKTKAGEWKCIMQDTTSKKTSFTGPPPR